MTKDNIMNMLVQGERVNIEVKRAKSEVPKSILETYSAFANTYGGTILLGVEENLAESDIHKRFTITGVDNARKIVCDFWNIINSDKVSANLLVDNDVQVVTIDGMDIVYIHVPQAEYSQRPVYINGNILKGSFRRNN
jgi:predicted HTH transcriptional regulator